MRLARLAGLTVAALATLVIGVGAAAGENALVAAVKNADGKGAAVAALLRRGVDANSADSYGSTALHWAAELDQIEVVELLLRAGADAKRVNRYGVAPISLAATNGNAAILTLLLAAGADPRTTLPGGETALMTASRGGSVAAVKALMARGAEVDAREPLRGQTALMWAAAEGHALVVEALVAGGADIHARSRRAASPRAPAPVAPARDGQADAPVPAARAGRAESPRSVGDYFTRSNGGVLNTPFVIDSMTPLMFAVRAGRTDAVRTLLESGASANETSANGLSVLVLAIINAHYELAAFLLDKGADVHAAGQGWTALHQVATTPRLSYGRFPHPTQTGRMSPLDLAKKLLDRGADVNARMTVPTMGDGYRTRLNRLGATPLLLAAKGAYPEMIALLLEHGADPKAVTVEGTTPLMLAAGVAIFNEGDDAGTEAETLAAVKRLVEHGVDVNLVDQNGETAMHGAAYRGHNSVVQYLADKGAALDVKNRIGWTPLIIADGVLYAEFLKVHRDTAALLRQLLKQRGVNVDDAGIVNTDRDPRANRSSGQ
jgi:ankyrin repeat protein